MDQGQQHAGMRRVHQQFGCCRTHTIRVSYQQTFSETHTKQTYQSAEIVPDFGDVGVQTYSPGVCIESVAVLVDLVVEHADRTPECRIASVAVNGLLVSFVRLGVFLLRHVTPPEEVPALCILLI